MFATSWPIPFSVVSHGARPTRSRLGMSDRQAASPRPACRNGGPELSSPAGCAVIPRETRKPRSAVLHFIAVPTSPPHCASATGTPGGCAPIVAGLFDSHRGRDGRGPKHRKGRVGAQRLTALRRLVSAPLSPNRTCKFPSYRLSMRGFRHGWPSYGHEGVERCPEAISSFSELLVRVVPSVRYSYASVREAD